MTIEVETYGCSVDELRKETLTAREYRKSGPVIYVGVLMARATELIDQNKPKEAKQMIARAHWVLVQFVLGDDE